MSDEMLIALIRLEYTLGLIVGIPSFVIALGVIIFWRRDEENDKKAKEWYE